MRAPPPAGLFDADKRHLLLLAHQDDEVPYAGLIQRMHRPKVVFLTNGDGLAHEAGMAPAAYAQLRREESIAALDAAGVPREDITFLDRSELTYYAEFGRMSEQAEAGPLAPVFEEDARRIDAIVEHTRPDAVWTMAWQGGNPEHDLVHLMASRAVARRLSEGDNVSFFELPAYELLVLVMRFGPWYTGEQLEIRLTDAALGVKKAMLGMYPTQARVIGELRRAIRLAGVLSRVRGKRMTLEDFARVEVFGRVPPQRDPTRSTHRSPRLDYPLDDWKGQRIRFERSLARIGAAWRSELF